MLYSNSRIGCGGLATGGTYPLGSGIGGHSRFFHAQNQPAHAGDGVRLLLLGSLGTHKGHQLRLIVVVQRRSFARPHLGDDVARHVL